MTATLERAPVEPGAAPPVPVEKRGVPRWALALLVVGLWIVAWYFTRGTDTLVVAGQDDTRLHQRITEYGTTLRNNRDTNPAMVVTSAIADYIDAVVGFFRRLIAIPTSPRPSATIGWFGVVAIATWIGYAIANWRTALLILLSFLSFGAFGYWESSMDLLVITTVAVALAVAIGMPLAILLALSDRASRVITLVLDLLQTMPTFVYLIPVVLFFGIGAPSAVVCTLAYALPPIVRIAGFGIREVSPTTIEATDSIGQTAWQRLRKVQLPMARRTIIVGLNQTILAALSMAIIASYVNGPGLGKPVVEALAKNDFGGGMVPGALTVLMGIMLDRTTTAASERAELVARGGNHDPRRRRRILGVLLGLVAVAIWYSRWSLNAAVFPSLTWGETVANKANEWMRSFVDLVEVPAAWFKNLISFHFLNYLQEMLANSPWWLAFGALAALSLIIGGRKAALPTAVCLSGIYLLDLWNDTMLTLTMTLVATVLVMIIALVVGVWMARSSSADLVIRPILDAGQTIPAFVYLIPVLALFTSSRFTAILAAVIYAAPAAIKLVADGVRGVSSSTVEAGRSTGSTTWQEIVKVQLPIAKRSLVLATNQGLLYVLAMVVIGGLVGAQALGYDVVLGLARPEFWGKGLAAGISIVLLGVWLDRVTRGAAERVETRKT